MNKFEKQLEKWNNGVLRGAQAKLAKLLQVSTATVALWSTGKRHPSKGYLNQLARIFNMDAYDVTRLFAPTTIYPDACLTPASTPLRDSSHTITYNTDKIQQELYARNSVSLPFFIHLPNSFPDYQEAHVAEWWALPRHAVLGAQFLLRAGEADTPPAQAEDILFLILADSWVVNSVMLVKKDNRYFIRRISRQHGKLVWQKNGQNFTAIPARVQPVGVVVRKITNSIF